MSVAGPETPDWKQWEGEVVSDEFPLEHFLGNGRKSAVFRTRTASGEAAIKLVPTSGSGAQALIEGWKRARAIDNPHFIKIARTGTKVRAFKVATPFDELSFSFFQRAEIVSGYFRSSTVFNPPPREVNV